MPNWSANHIENEAAYADAIQERRKRNAIKGRRQRWFAEDATREALIQEIEGKAERNAFMRSMMANFDKWGSLTPGQEAAVRRILAGDEAEKAKRRDERRVRDAGSAFVGEVGKRAEFAVVLESVFTSTTDYGVTHAHAMRDGVGNVISYRGGTRLSVPFEGSKFLVPVEKGAEIVLKASVKKHDEYDGTKRTVIQRPTVVKAPAPRVSELPHEHHLEWADEGRVKFPTWGWLDVDGLYARSPSREIVPYRDSREGWSLLLPTATVERILARNAKET